MSEPLRRLAIKEKELGLWSSGWVIVGRLGSIAVGGSGGRGVAKPRELGNE